MSRGVHRRGRSRLDTALLFFDQALVSGCGFLAMLLIVRSSGVAVFGAFAIVSTVALFIVGLQQALISQPMMSLAPAAASDASGRATYFGSILLQQALLTAAVACSSPLIYAALEAFWADPLLASAATPGALLLVSRQAYVFFRGYYLTKGEVRRVAVNDAVVFAGQLCLLGGLAADGSLELASALWSQAALFGLGALIGLFQIGSVRFSWTDFLASSARHWRFSRWLVVQTVFQWSSSNAFLLAAGALLGSAAVGALKVAHSLVGVLGVLLLTLENFVPLDAARALAHEGTIGLHRYLRGVLARGGLLILPIAAALALWPGLVLGVFDGGESGAWAEQALRWFAGMYVLAFLSTLLTIGLRTVERTGRIAFCNIIIAVPVLFLAQPIVATFGFVGACAGIVVHKLVLTLSLAWTFRGAAGSPSIGALQAESGAPKAAGDDEPRLGASKRLAA